MTAPRFAGRWRCRRRIYDDVAECDAAGASALSGLFVGSLYGLIGLGLGLSWGLLRTINLAHFAFIFAAAYLCYQLVASTGVDPPLTLLVIVPLFFALGAGLHWLVQRFEVSPLNSLLVTFGVTAIIEAAIQAIWSADFRRLESHYGHANSSGACCSCRCPS